VATLSGGSASLRAAKDLPPDAAVDGPEPVVSYAEDRTGPHALRPVDA